MNDMTPTQALAALSELCHSRDDRTALSVIERHVQDMDLLIEAADRLSFEVQYFDDHPPELCAIKRAALHLDGLLASAGREVYREGAAALPASGTQTAANAGRNRVAREKGA